ncbi:MAG TPA: SPOR domain-containing protein [Candidatus Sulfotelmatobacter sp.]|nr:SPOR domain-containing protein [Candidatus Sulfotelmatobacter sp.]
MPSSQDTEITLGTGKLLFLFFGLVAMCAVFFALGYSLGRKSEPAITTASAAIAPQNPVNSKAASQSAPPMTFYKAVEQKDASPELTPSADTKTDTTATPAAASTPTSTASPVDPSTTIPSAGYYVQVAAVSKQEDADSLVDALKKKEYSAFVSPTATADKLFHVQVGPFSDIKDAEAMRAKLISDGYSPIVKK